MITPEERIRKHLMILYGQPEASRLWHRLQSRLGAFCVAHPYLEQQGGRLDQRDVILITYGDQISESDQPPLQTLTEFLISHLGDLISGIHILPFYPFSSDDGFSVIDYRKVNPILGSWEDIARLGNRYRLMFDLVANHISAESEWFQNFLTGVKPHTDYFITLEPTTDLSQVVRPRATPVLTPFQTSNGLRYVWTTFSEDQIDLDYSNPKVLLEMIDVLLFYVEQGAQIIRLDAIAYLWKIPGTSCIHLPQTHAVVKLFRAILDIVAPSVLLITETNVPHQENISYFGDYLPALQRSDEAQLVYQFPLAPLILHTFLTGDSTHLTNWAESLPELPLGTIFFNFTASHDGIGVRPAEGLLNPDEIQELIQTTLNHRGQVSYRSNSDGSRSAYELNITWFDALNDPAKQEPDLDVQRFLASQAIMLSLAGVPGIYIHSLLGSRNCTDCLVKTGQARSINREKYLLTKLDQELSDSDNLKSRVLKGYRHLLHIRKQQFAFHPAASQRVLSLSPDVFATLRQAETGAKLLCVTNVTPKFLDLEIDLSKLGLQKNEKWVDLLRVNTYFTHDAPQINLAPYQYRWLKMEP